jgi:hypothetical protein
MVDKYLKRPSSCCLCIALTLHSSARLKTQVVITEVINCRCYMYIVQFIGTQHIRFLCKAKDNFDVLYISLHLGQVLNCSYTKDSG